MKLRACPECEHQILDKIGTVCPSCGHTTSFFEGSTKRPKYGKFFAISVFLPFLSFITIIFAAQNKFTLLIGSIIYFILMIFSCPIRYKDLFFTKFEAVFFWIIWIVANSLLSVMVINLLNKNFFN